MVTSLPAILDEDCGLTWAEKLAYLTYKFQGETQIECPVEHSFENGNYIRTMRIPAGTLFIGRVHTLGHQCDLVEGRVRWIEWHGDRELEAPFFLTTTPGHQAVFQALTDVVGRTYHPNPTESRDVVALEALAFESLDSLKLLGQDVASRLEARQLEAA